MSTFLLLVPFLAVVVLNLLPKRARVAAFAITFLVLALETAAAFVARFVAVDWSFLAPVERVLGFGLSLDHLGGLLLLCAGIVGMAALLVGRRTLAEASERFMFANLVLVALVGINGIAMVRDLFTLYVFVEVTAVATFILITLRHEGQAFEGAWKYIILSAVASVLMLSSIGLTLIISGDTSFNAIRISTSTQGGPLLLLIMGMFLSGLFAKLFASVIGAKVELMNTDGSQGAARGAGIGCGLYKQEADAFVGLTPVATVTPDAKLRKAYGPIYTRWAETLERTF
jgi:formate hydrogenlyase subunit 3/multisubunit Na+/H+ antiporter MnhD subunit